MYESALGSTLVTVRSAWRGRRGLVAAAVALAWLGLAACGGSGPIDRVTPTPVESGTVSTAEAKVVHDQIASIHSAMLTLNLSTNLPRARTAAERVINLIAGPGGRHAGDVDGDGHVADLPKVGVFPPDAPDDSTPGLALALYDTADTSPEMRAALAGIVMGDREAWRAPAARYDEIDRAVAVTAGGENAVQDLDGHLMRAMAWALLALQADNLDQVHEYAGHGEIHTALSLRAIARELEANR